MHLSTLTENGVFSTENGTLLLSDSALWCVLCDNIIENMNAKGYVGLDVDFEYLGRENASLYAGFIAYLRERLNAVGYTVTVALAPKVRRRWRRFPMSAAS